MAKVKSFFECQQCAATHPQWQGKCSECGAWNSLVEIQGPAKKSASVPLGANNPKEKKVSTNLFFDAQGASEKTSKRISSTYKEIDRVLGGGFVSGSLLLFGGRPGIGKSTLLLQMAGAFAQKNGGVFYLSGEESRAQVLGRARRLNLPESGNLFFMASMNLEDAIKEIDQKKPELIVVDSIQTISSAELESVPGSVSQVRGVCHHFLEYAKSQDVTVLLVGQITKDGSIAGPKLVEHMVDAVFYFDLSSSGGYRLLKAHKNRFGSVNELAVLEMNKDGLAEVENPSERFLKERNDGMAGSSVVAQQEGSQIYLLEVQSIVNRCYQGYPRRTTQGVDGNRLAVLLAVAEKILELNFSEQDVYCKVASGGEITEPAADLPLLFCLASALRSKALASDTLMIGEVGLGGELRSVSSIGARLKEAKSLGFKKVIIPKHNQKEIESIKDSDLEVLALSNVQEVFKAVF